MHQSHTCKVILALDHGDPDGSQREDEQNHVLEGTQKRRVTAARRVCLKFMRNREQWQQEISMRNGITAQGKNGQPIADSSHVTINEEFVVGVLRSHDGSVEGSRLQDDLAKRKLQDYPFILCMPRADRSLADVLQHEHFVIYSFSYSKNFLLRWYLDTA